MGFSELRNKCSEIVELTRGCYRFLEIGDLLVSLIMLNHHSLIILIYVISVTVRFVNGIQLLTTGLLV